MMDSDFYPFTIFAGVVFGGALVWVMVQWLRADESADKVDRELRAAEPRVVPAQTPPAPLPDTTAEDVVLARKLLWWGSVATVLGLIVGAAFYRFTGALVGGVAGSVLGTVGATVAVSLRRKVEQTGEAPVQAATAAAPETERTHPLHQA